MNRHPVTSRNKGGARNLTFNLRVKVIDDDLQLCDVHSMQQLPTERSHLTVHEARDAHHLATTTTTMPPPTYQP